MIVDNLDFSAKAVPPHEADAPLSVDTDTVLTCTPSLQHFQMIRRRNSQVVQTLKEMKATHDAIQREMIRRPELLKAMQNETVRKYVDGLKK